MRLSDAGSLNGTEVNGQLLTSDVSVRDGDKVMFGSLTFEVYEAARLHQLLLHLD
jgi:pSer/pThr/pTyr-binding forkhead associated (FHA) protein